MLRSRTSCSGLRIRRRGKTQGSGCQRLLTSRRVLESVDRGRLETLNGLRECASTSWQSQVVIPSKCCEAAQRRKAPKREPAGGFKWISRSE